MDFGARSFVVHHLTSALGMHHVFDTCTSIHACSKEGNVLVQVAEERFWVGSKWVKCVR